MITLSITKISPERENVRKNVLHKYLENPRVLQLTTENYLSHSISCYK